jgi:hypothetical protein
MERDNKYYDFWSSIRRGTAVTKRFFRNALNQPHMVEHDHDCKNQIYPRATAEANWRVRF